MANHLGHLYTLIEQLATTIYTPIDYLSCQMHQWIARFYDTSVTTYDYIKFSSGQD